MCDHSCYSCGHAPEDHIGETAECEKDGCDCAWFEERDCDEE